MQANHILASGFPLIASDVTQYRDMALPDFRSIARKSGATVNGVYVTGNSQTDVETW
jgi:hypothetical protein